MFLKSKHLIIAFAASAAISAAPAIAAQQSPVRPQQSGGPAAIGPSGDPISASTYADLADLTLPSAIIAEVNLRRSTLLTPEEAPQVSAGFRRFLVEADVTTLIRGPQGLSAGLRFVVDLPVDARGRAAAPRRRSAWIIFANPVPNRPDEVRLVAPDSHLASNPEIAERVRGIVREAVAPGAPPRITAIGRAFNVPGALPGTGETQIFLQSASNQPFSITINRAGANERPTWFVSTSEFVDAGATQPQRDTLLWYRLACTLPAQLPPASLAESGASAAQINADYRVVREGLGTCSRTRRR